MTVDLSEEDRIRIIRALQHYADYLHATSRSDSSYAGLVERLQALRKQVASETAKPAVSKRRAQ